jgi:hypothetical protein
MHNNSHRFLFASLVVLSLLTGACDRFASGVIHATGTSRNVLVNEGEFNQDVELWYESATSYRAVGSGDELYGVGTMYIREGDRLAVACYLSNRELSATIGPVATDPFLVWHPDTAAVAGGQVVTHDNYDDIITHFDLYNAAGDWSLTLEYTEVERLDDTPLGTIENQLVEFDADIPDCGA